MKELRAEPQQELREIPKGIEGGILRWNPIGIERGFLRRIPKGIERGVLRWNPKGIQRYPSEELQEESTERSIRELKETPKGTLQGIV